MEFIETTISEHIYNQGKAEGKAEGKIEILKKLYKQGILSEQQMKKMMAPIRRKKDKAK